jgi:tRNA modification GTPase
LLARQSDPIIAVATAPGRGAIGVVRLSAQAPLLAAFSKALLGLDLLPRQATLVTLKDAEGDTIDQVLALYFPGPHSFTGEDVLELQGHGGPVVMQLVLARCMALAHRGDERNEGAWGQVGKPGALPRLRMAEPGEFSQRAFLNNKLDLAQAEAIADLIDASTEAAARSAGRSLAGDFSREIQHLLNALIHLRMLVEATLDFPEEDIDFLQQANAQGKLAALVDQLNTLLPLTRQGVLLKDGIRVVIAGQPNAGKSSLLNALAGAELAIVTPIPGTTRDKVTQTIQIEGVPLHVVDTAGLRDSEDVVEQMGIERAWGEIGQADVVLFLHDLTRWTEPAYQRDEAQIAAHLKQSRGGENHNQTPPWLDVWNKSDQASPEVLSGINSGLVSGPVLSAKTGEGLNDLRAQLLQLAGWTGSSEGLFMARQRHVQALLKVQDHLNLAQAQLACAMPALDLLAEELRLGQNALNEITGAFNADDLLGVIFSEFCIGK